MGHTVVRPAEREYQPLDRGASPTRFGRAALTSGGCRPARATRATWSAQEELFVVLEGEAALLVGEPPERVVLPRGSIAIVETGTPLKLRNESSDAAVVLVVGAPPETGKAEYLPEIE